MPSRLNMALMLSALLLPLTTCAKDVTIYGGKVNFAGDVVNAACAVSTDSVNMTVHMGQVRNTAFQSPGDWSTPTDFQIHLEDCDTAVSQSAGILFTGTTDVKDPQVFKSGYGASAAEGVGIGIFDASGNLIVPDTRPPSLSPIHDGENILRFRAKYRAITLPVKAGHVRAEVWFNVFYS